MKTGNKIFENPEDVGTNFRMPKNFLGNENWQENLRKS